MVSVKNIHSKEFRNILLELSNENGNEFTLIDWNLINDIVDEIKENLYQLPTDNNRVAYLRAVLNEFQDNFLESWLEDVFRHVRFFNEIYWVNKDVSAPKEIKPNIIAAAKYIEWRRRLISVLAEHCLEVYPGFCFGEVMEGTSIKTGHLVWEERSKAGSESKNNGELNLQNQFNKPEKYFEVLKKLSQAGRIIEYNEVLTFIPKRGGSKYEPEALRRALQILGYLKKQDFSDSELVTLFSNTFQGYNACEKTIRSTSIPNVVEYYIRILS